MTRLTREGCVIAVRVRGCGGSVDERLRRRRRRPVLVGGRGVRVVRRMVAESSRTTQKQTAVTRHGRHVMVMVLVHSPAKIDSRVKRKETKRSETRRDETRRDETRRNDFVSGEPSLLTSLYAELICLITMITSNTVV